MAQFRGREFKIATREARIMRVDSQEKTKKVYGKGLRRKIVSKLRKGIFSEKKLKQPLIQLESTGRKED